MPLLLLLLLLLSLSLLRLRLLLLLLPLPVLVLASAAVSAAASSVTASAAAVLLLPRAWAAALETLLSHRRPICPRTAGSRGVVGHTGSQGSCCARSCHALETSTGSPVSSGMPPLSAVPSSVNVWCGKACSTRASKSCLRCWMRASFMMRHACTTPGRLMELSLPLSAA